MAHIVRPQFGSRQYRPAPNWYRARPPAAKPWRIDWQLVSLVAIVFVASFVWLFPALDEQACLIVGPSAPVPEEVETSIDVVDGDTVVDYWLQPDPLRGEWAFALTSQNLDLKTLVGREP